MHNIAFGRWLVKVGFLSKESFRYSRYLNNKKNLNVLKCFNHVNVCTESKLAFSRGILQPLNIVRELF